MPYSSFSEARDFLANEFRRTLVGPGKPDEILKDAPSRSYICGILHPSNTHVQEDQNDELQEGDNESSLEGIPSLINAMNPSAMGMTFHVKPGVKAIKLSVDMAFYELVNLPLQGTCNQGAPDEVKIAPSVATSPLARLGRKKKSDDNKRASGVPYDQTPIGEVTEEGWKRLPFTTEVNLDVNGPTCSESKLFEEVKGPASSVVLDLRRHVSGDGLPVLLTVTLINRNVVEEKSWLAREQATIFQPRLVVEALEDQERDIFVEAPVHDNLRSDPDHAQHLLLYRHARDLGTGHGCALSWDRASHRHSCGSRVWTEFIPRATVTELGFDLFGSDDEGQEAKAAVLTALPASDKDSDPNSIFSMRHLAGDRSDVWILAALEGLCAAYEAWLNRKMSEIGVALDELREGSPRDLVRDQAALPNLHVFGREVLVRMRGGIESLRQDPVIFRCFRLANEVMYDQQLMSLLQSAAREEKSPASLDLVSSPKWRPFQLAFLLLTVNSISRPDWSTGPGKPTDRDLMDLIWFPTGGGKTEAYLGLTAFTLLFRRLRHEQNPDSGAGVSVITRYTLRLLTTQQFDRAARLLCALDVLRERGKDIRSQSLDLGRQVFRIGLWIGGSSTPNRFADIGNGPDRVKGAVSILEDLYQGIEPETGADLRQIRTCPWCGTGIKVSQMRIEAQDGSQLRDGQKIPSGSQPKLVVRCKGTLPAPLNGKCPFVRETGLPTQLVDEEIYAYPPSVVIGTVDKFARLIWSSDARSLFGRTSHGDRLPPPDLIIQDELHLISGPLGTMVGQFETVIEALSRDEKSLTPKIIGSTATIRRADEQVLGLFNRAVRQFPPPALTAGDSFFARTDLSRPGRVYLGVMAPGISGKSLALRTMGALTQLASELPENVRDPYWTLVSYFNSIRELAGANVLAQDDVPNFMRSFVQIRQRLGSTTVQRLLALPEELTSRKKASEIPAILQKLQQPLATGNSIDLLLATNMISVGVDIDRLGIMTIQGQPKTTAEYIQASSRVGRRYPGLVVTLFNWTRSRDRSHYERFLPYHEAFYREVEASSVTPWSSPTRDRLLSGLMIAILRNLDLNLIETPRYLWKLTEQELLKELNIILERVKAQDPREESRIVLDIETRFRNWKRWARYFNESAKYGSGLLWDRKVDRMLRTPTSPGGERDGLESAPNSMRTVEPETGFHLKMLPSQKKVEARVD
jgi:hypothetical protein